MARAKKDGPEILAHTSIRLEDGTVLSAGDEAKLADALKKEDLDRLQNEQGAIAGFVADRKGKVEAPAQLPPTGDTVQDTGAQQ